MIEIAAAGSTISLKAFAAVMLSPASALNVKSEVPAVVGVPEIVPFPLRVSPAGNAPSVRVQVSASAPAALSACEYCVPAVAFGRADSVVMAKFTVRVKVLLAEEY